MALRKILGQLNIFAQCRTYKLPLWQCPQFLFLIMGILIGLTSIITYIIGTHYIEDPAIIAFIVLLLSVILFVIAFLIVHSFEKLAEANRMKSEFVSIVSHQLRSPLSNLTWALEFLMSEKSWKIEKGQIEYFRILKENTARMQELISSLLIVARIESTTLPLSKQEFSLVDLTKQTLEQFKLFATASNVELKLKHEQNLPLVFADKMQTRQVISNFIDNAIRYIQGKGSIVINIKKKTKNLYFEIRDTGTGIGSQDQKYIFQKFFRSENILKHQTQGSGLGLFIAKAIINKSGGQIGFESQLGKGATFWFTLPIK